jgi:hypothetical protein
MSQSDFAGSQLPITDQFNVCHKNNNIPAQPINVYCSLGDNPNNKSHILVNNMENNIMMLEEVKN